MNRRSFLRTTLAGALAATLPAFARPGRPPRILLRSAWQTVNIGDVGHTPGVLALLEQYFPEVEVHLWPSDISNGVEDMLRRRFPRLVIVPRDKDARENAYRQCDFLLHGSGPFLIAVGELARWKQMGKPYGIYGITTAPEGDPAMKLMNNPGLDARTRDLLSGASFVFLRDSASLETVKRGGVTSPVIEFGPDGAFAADVRDDRTALAFMRANGLEEGRFLCCIPNLRSAPYWRIKRDRAFDPAKHARNEEMKEHDHAPLREAIIAVVRNTPMKILVCPEDATHMEVGKELLVDPLPQDVKAKVVWRKSFWLTDEALSTYVRSAGLFGNDMHSPIMCIGNGVPAIHCHQREKTTKGLMWRDIGLNEWYFSLDEEWDLPRIAPAVLDLARDPVGSKARAAKARAFVQRRQRETMEILRRALPSPLG